MKPWRPGFGSVLTVAWSLSRVGCSQGGDAVIVADPRSGQCVSLPDNQCDGGIEMVADPRSGRCAPPTDNECDGNTDLDPRFPNGSWGNAFDDDCDGQVDEGCSCDRDHAYGTSRTCFLISSAMADPLRGWPVGWCADNAVGTQTCIVGRPGEFAQPVWNSECRGALPPYPHDFCAAGDYDCDGIEANSPTNDCSAERPGFRCPSEPLLTRPFPDPTNLPEIDGTKWPAPGRVARDWTWTVSGGDCDNILPHPSFAIYDGKDTRTARRISSDSPQENLTIRGNQRGFIIRTSGQAGGKIYPAFTLSGGYQVKGEWDDQDGHHGCSVGVQARAPGIRAELCWSPIPSDLDLHVARLQNPLSCEHGWFTTCSAGEDGDDCYDGLADSLLYPLGCTGDFSTDPSAWGYAASADGACHGWGSVRTPGQSCPNPRLDMYSANCDGNVADPLVAEDPSNISIPFGFCTAENINIDDPKHGERFLVGAHYFGDYEATAAGAKRVHPHVNIYCNGQRKLALGYDPTLSRPIDYPVLLAPGWGPAGDFWQVAIVQAMVDAKHNLYDCVVTPIHSKAPVPEKDGSQAFCVDTNATNGSSSPSQSWQFLVSGGWPASADDVCSH